MKISLLNLGCGARFHPDWVNVDIHPAAAMIRQWNLREELPYPDATFDVVYHSHVLEHFSRSDGMQFMRRCYRILRPGGTIRVVVPDLEGIVRLYLEALEKSLDGDPVWRQRYEWILLEMYDQAVRDTSGGEMLAYIQRDPIPERDFVSARMGSEFEAMIRLSETLRGSYQPAQGPEGNAFSRKVAQAALGKEGLRAHDVGCFRLSGETHRWMYDRYSLGDVLEQTGFHAPRPMKASESSISMWSSYHLDTNSDGSVYKPDSLYMEAIKP